MEAGECDQPAAALSNQRAAAPTIDRHQMPDPILVEFRDTEETVVAALGRQAVEERQERGGVFVARHA
jgi:hypothetical protein